MTGLYWSIISVLTLVDYSPDCFFKHRYNLPLHNNAQLLINMPDSAISASRRAFQTTRKWTLFTALSPDQSMPAPQQQSFLLKHLMRWVWANPATALELFTDINNWTLSCKAQINEKQKTVKGARVNLKQTHLFLKNVVATHCIHNLIRLKDRCRQVITVNTVYIQARDKR